MKENIYFNQALERIRKIKKSDKIKVQNVKGSHIILFLEHIIKMNRYAVKLNLSKSNLLEKDLCEELNDEWSYENSMDEKLQREIWELHPRYYQLLRYLNWELHRPELETLGIEYTINPYEPILKFIERDGLYLFELYAISLGQQRNTFIRTNIITSIKVLPEESYTDLSDENLDLADVEFVKNPKLFLENSIEKFRKNRERYKSI